MRRSKRRDGTDVGFGLEDGEGGPEWLPNGWNSTVMFWFSFRTRTQQKRHNDDDKKDEQHIDALVQFRGVGVCFWGHDAGVE